MDLLVAALQALALVVTVSFVLVLVVAYAPSAMSLVRRGFDWVAQAILDRIRARVGGGWAAYGYGSDDRPSRPQDPRRR